MFLWWAIFASLWLTLLVVRQLRGLLVQVALALFLSFALEPIIDRLDRRGVRRGIATALCLLALFVGAVVFLAAMGSLIATQLTELVEDLPGYLTSGQVWLDQRWGIEVSTDDLISQFQDGGAASRYANDLAGNLLGVGSTVANLLFQTLTVFIFTFYLAADGPRLRRVICSFFPPDRQRTVLAVWELAINKTGAYISSRLILAVTSAVFHWVVLTLLELPSAVALAIWVGVISQFIPTLGTYLAGSLPALVALGIDPGKALWVVIAVVVYQQIENYVLQPRITAQTLDLHPAVAIAAVLGGTSLFGAPGALLALPVVATAGGFLTAYVERHDLVEDQSTLGGNSHAAEDETTASPES
ncbi:MAG: putative PurR-regulated permease PerM [Acidimicrobiales bacterium]|jgi:predicted PurR-regulated permease PerM